ncbi:arylsulfatase [Mycobacterium sp. DL592]|uniref:arylsulfatase n=1 Tax=Mycobacterium sp. DL592 TaxID=2675524 RepID=UPI001424773D|nr:arylsulfatase [Mycobacterium sp. DL592]
MRAPSGAPNVLMIVLDDLGFGQLGCFGSDIATPNIDKLASDGLRYNRFHVTALCSPTRAALLTGRNHHAVGMGMLTDLPTDLPGYSGRIPPSTPTLPRVLRDAGWSTMAFGKWHLAPRYELGDAGPFERWPLGLGFERYYGFLGGDTNQWAPRLVRDNSSIVAPKTPAQGYHLTEDLADQAIRMVVNQQESAPGKPFFTYFAPGAMHAPHHVPASWADAYAGRFDQGWDRWREEVFARQVATGVVPRTTTLTARPSWVPAWADLSSDERRVYARMLEVFAGFLSHTDAQIGRLLDALRHLGVYDDTLILLLSDNGASAEGGVSGTVNEHLFAHGIRGDVATSLAHLADWGGPNTYPHYAWGWAWAGNTPFRLWKRYSWLGGTRVPLIAHWPRVIGAQGGRVRGQFTHAIDVMPTVLEACGIEQPVGLDGASALATFTDPDAPDPRSTQYFEMLGSRSIVSQGWKATTDHVSGGVVDEEELLTGSRDFDSDRWSLFRLDEDFSEAHDVADAHPDIVESLARQWLSEAERNNVLPLADSLIARFGRLVPPDYPPRSHTVIYPAGGPVSDEVLPSLVAGAEVSADVEVADSGSDGVLFALGDRIAGLVAYVTGGRLTVTVVILGDTVTVGTPAVGGGRHRLGCRLAPQSGGGTRVEAIIDGQVAATGLSSNHLPFVWQIGGTQLRPGYDEGIGVCDGYQPPFAWTGTLYQVDVVTGQRTLGDPAAALVSLKTD